MRAYLTDMLDAIGFQSIPFSVYSQTPFPYTRSTIATPLVAFTSLSKMRYEISEMEIPVLRSGGISSKISGWNGGTEGLKNGESLTSTMSTVMESGTLFEWPSFKITSRLRLVGVGSSATLLYVRVFNTSWYSRMESSPDIKRVPVEGL